MVTRGFQGKARVDNDRVPPGQHVVGDFPVLTAGATEDIAQHDWQMTIRDALTSKTYDWESLHALGVETMTTDIHCVTHWSKLDTTWSGVPLSKVFDDAGVGDYDHAIISSYGGYTTNLPLSDLTDHDAMIATSYEGEPITSEHGGPVRLLVPHLYLWKSAKWLSDILLSDDDEPGFWEVSGYHSYGDPWLEQRYFSD